MWFWDDDETISVGAMTTRADDCEVRAIPGLDGLVRLRASCLPAAAPGDACQVRALADALRRARLRAGCSRAELAAALHLAPAEVVALENGYGSLPALRLAVRRARLALRAPR